MKNFSGKNGYVGRNNLLQSNSNVNKIVLKIGILQSSL